MTNPSPATPPEPTPDLPDATPTRRTNNPVPDFTPAPRRSKRFDGWTVARQRGFIAALAETGSVTAAAASVGKAAVGAYALRRAPGAESFDAAWEAALDDGVRRLAAIAFSRASEGVAVPIMFAGKQVAEKRVYPTALLMFLLRHHDPAKYGANPGLRPGTKSLSRTAQEDSGESMEQAQLQQAELLARISEKLRRTRDLYVRAIAHDRKKRAAWDRLCPRVNWKVAAGGVDTQVRRDGTAAPLFIGQVDQVFPNMNRPEFIIPITNGYLPDLTNPTYEPEGDPIRQWVQSIKDNASASEDGEADDIDVDQATANLRAAWGKSDWTPGEDLSAGET